MKTLACCSVALAWTCAPAETTVANLIRAAMWGADVPYVGTQRSWVATNESGVSSTLKVDSDGRGGVRRTFVDGPAKGVVLLEVDGHLYKRSTSGWQTIGHVAGADRTAAVAALLANYRVTVGAPTTLLDRSAIVVDVRPKLPHNPARRWVLDAKTLIVLKDEMIAPDGRRRSLTQFSSLKILDHATPRLSAPQDATESFGIGPGSFEPLESSAAVKARTGSDAPKPGYVPLGYRPTHYGIVHTGIGRLSPAVRYSDGLSTFTVFERGRRRNRYGQGRGNGPGPRWGVYQEPKTDIQRAVASVETQTTSFLLIGDLAETELKRIAQSLR